MAYRPGKRARWTIFAVYCVLLLAASCWPEREKRPETISLMRRGADKVVHVAAYALLTLLWLWACSRSGGLSAGHLLFAAIFATGYGAVIEAIQLGLPHRTGSIQDAAANGLGALAASLATGILHRVGQTRGVARPGS